MVRPLSAGRASLRDLEIAEVHLGGDMGSQCPYCGNIAGVMEGSFRFALDFAEVLAAPEWTMRRCRSWSVSSPGCSSTPLAPADEVVAAVASVDRTLAASVGECSAAAGPSTGS